jgi:hypothetical protein
METPPTQVKRSRGRPKGSLGKKKLAAITETKPDYTDVTETVDL